MSILDVLVTSEGLFYILLHYYHSSRGGNSDCQYNSETLELAVPMRLVLNSQGLSLLLSSSDGIKYVTNKTETVNTSFLTWSLHFPWFPHRGHAG